MWEEPNHMTARKPSPLQIIHYSLVLASLNVTLDSVLQCMLGRGFIPFRKPRIGLVLFKSFKTLWFWPMFWPVSM